MNRSRSLSRALGLRAQPPVLSPLPASVLRAPLVALIRGPEALTTVSTSVAQHLGARDVLLTDSGTSALRLAMWGATRGGRLGSVALPAYCCYDVASAAIGASVKVQLFDIDPLTLSADLRSLETCLSRGASAVVVAHLYGLPADMATVRSLVRSAGAILIEDAAQAVGAQIGGRPAGAWGDVAVLSFGRGKGVTGGGGGALAAINEHGEAIIAHARDQALPGEFGLGRWPGLVGQFVLGRPSLYGLPLRIPFLRLGETRYRAPHAPRQMATLPAVVVGWTWRLQAEEVTVRRRHALRLLEHVGGRLRAFTVVPEAVPSYLRLPVVAQPLVARAVADGSWRSLGLARGYPLALPALPALLDSLVPGQRKCPGARELAAALVTLPTHSLLVDGDLRDLERWLSAVSA